MMLITSIEQVSKMRTRVTIDEDMTLVLSNKDLNAYHIRQGQELDDADYQRLRAQLRSDALLRAGRILKGMDYTEKALRDKLIRAGYPSDIADDTVERLVAADYVNDRRYAENYIRVHLSDRSLARIRSDLIVKGIPRDLLEEALRSYEEERGGDVAGQERAQIRRFLIRKHYDPDTMTYEDTARIKMALLKKGFSMDRIREEMDAIN